MVQTKQEKLIHALKKQNKDTRRIGSLFKKHHLTPATPQDINNDDFRTVTIHRGDGKTFPTTVSLVVKGKHDEFFNDIKKVKTPEGFEVQEGGKAISFPHMKEKDADELVRKLTKHRKAGSPLT